MALVAFGLIAWMLSREGHPAALFLWITVALAAMVFAYALVQRHSRRAVEYIVLDGSGITGVYAGQHRTLRWELIGSANTRSGGLILADSNHFVEITLSRQLNDFRGAVKSVLTHLESAYDRRSSGARSRPSKTDVSFILSVRPRIVSFLVLVSLFAASAWAFMDEWALTPGIAVLATALWYLGRTVHIVTLGPVIKVRTLVGMAEIPIDGVRAVALEANKAGTPMVAIQDVDGKWLDIPLPDMPGRQLELYDRIRRLTEIRTGEPGTTGMTTRVVPIRAALLAASGVLIGAILFGGSVATGELLRYSSEKGSPSLARIAIASGSPLDAPGIDRLPPLHLATKFDHNSIAHLLLASGANPAKPYGKASFTPLHLAAEYGRVDIARMLVENGAPIDAPNTDGWTPLHVAVRYDKRPLMEYLIHRGANVGVRTNQGNTALSLALIEKRYDALRVMINAGANPNVTNANDYAPLQTAVWDGQVDLVDTLLRHGANPNVAVKTVDLPLYLAIQRGHTEIARVLLNAGAKWDVEAEGWTAVQRAASEGNVALVKELIYRGADPRAPSSIAPPPLLIAAERGHLPMVSTLVELGVDPNLQWRNWSALRVAGNRKHYPVIDYLRAHGAS